MNAVDDLGDGTSLAAVAAETDDAPGAFEELIRRHGPMVLNVCRRQLGDAHEAEDAAQATFLVLWKKAKSVRNRSSVAGWLHHVARNICRNAKRAREVRRMHEREGAKLESIQTDTDGRWDDVKAVLDEAIERLPEKYRLPVILFHLEGRSVQEVAALLGANESTITTWLSRGREALSRHVSRLGVVTTAIGLSTSLAANAEGATVSTAFISTTTHNAKLFAAGKLASAGAFTANTGALAEGAIRIMTLSKLKLAATILIAVSLPAGMLATWLATAPPIAADDARPKAAVDDDARLIRGTWIVREHRQTRREPSKEENEFLKQGNFKIQITADTLTFLSDMSGAKYRLNSAKKPKGIEFVSDDGKLNARGIYELKGDALKICVGRKSVTGVNEAPTDFDVAKAKPGADPTLFVMVRDNSVAEHEK